MKLSRDATDASDQFGQRSFGVCLEALQLDCWDWISHVEHEIQDGDQVPERLVREAASNHALVEVKEAFSRRLPIRRDEIPAHMAYIYLRGAD